jgi:hypothetical protein
MHRTSSFGIFGPPESGRVDFIDRFDVPAGINWCYQVRSGLKQPDSTAELVNGSSAS